jgi:hypothetical protein
VSQIKTVSHKLVQGFRQPSQSHAFGLAYLASLKTHCRCSKREEARRMFNTGLREILSKTARLGLREAGEFAALKVNLFQSIWFRPLHGAFSRIGEMNFAGVTIAEGISAQREAQSYCSRDCRRVAAYGRERFKARLEASDKVPGTLVAGRFRNEAFSSIETIPCKPTEPLDSDTLDQWPRCKVCKRWELLPRSNLPCHMFCIALRKRQSVASRSDPAQHQK